MCNSRKSFTFALVNKKIMKNEDFCSYETSKMLKEIGFDEPFYFYYRSDDDIKNMHHVVASQPLCYNLKYVDDEVIAAPTYQEAMRWFRDKKNIIIEISTFWPANPELTIRPYTFLIEDYRENRDKDRGGKFYTGYSSRANMDEFLIKNDYLKEGLGFGEFLKYEEAVDAAMKYCYEVLKV